MDHISHAVPELFHVESIPLTLICRDGDMISEVGDEALALKIKIEARSRGPLKGPGGVQGDEAP